MQGNALNNRGVILIVVLITMAALVSMVLVLERRSSVNFDYSSRLLMQNQAALYFSSAIKVAKKLLKNDNNGYDAEEDEWFNLPPFKASSDTLVSLSIFPVNAKININGVIDKNKTLRAKIQSAFLYILSDRGENGSDMLKNLLLWFSPKSANDYTDLPYKPTRKPFYSLKEVDYVKGFGSFSSKFHNYFTAADTMGKININFAPKEVIENYLPQLSDCVDDIVDYRKKKPFKNITELRNVGCISDEVYLKVLPYITTKSTLFDVRIGVKIGDESFQAEALLKREGKSVKVLKYFEGKGFYE